VQWLRNLAILFATFMLEGLWGIALVYTLLQIHREVQQMKWDDPQVRALREHGVGHDLVQQGDFAEALRYCTHQLHAGASSKDCLYWLRAAARLGLADADKKITDGEQLEKAIADCNEALARNLYLTAAYRIRAACHYHMGDWVRAAENLEYALRLGEVDPTAYLQQADVLQRLGRTEHAAAAAQRARQLTAMNT